MSGEAPWDEKTLEEALEKISIARTQLMLKQPFWGYLVMQLVPKPRAGRFVAATDGKHFLFNPEEIAKMPIEHVMTILAHETSHLAFRHIQRRGKRNPEKWNVAADLATNAILVDAGFVLPEGSLYDPSLRGKYAEEIYDMLPDPPPRPGGFSCHNCRSKNVRARKVVFHRDGRVSVEFECKDCGHVWEEEFTYDPRRSDGDGIPLPIDENTVIIGEPPRAFDEHPSAGKDKDRGMGGMPSGPIIDEKTLEKWTRLAQQAALHARRRGKLPGAVEQLITELFQPKVDWRAVLREFILRGLKTDYTWIPPNKKHIWRDMYLPGMKEEGCGDVVVLIDTSGSISDRELAEFFSEVRAIKEAHPMTLHVIQHDAAVQKYEVFDVHEDVPNIMKAYGRGGTDHRPPFEFVRKHIDRPNVIIVLTDAYTVWPDEPPPAPTLIVTVPDHGRLPSWSHVHLVLPRD